MFNRGVRLHQYSVPSFPLFSYYNCSCPMGRVTDSDCAISKNTSFCHKDDYDNTWKSCVSKCDNSTLSSTNGRRCSAYCKRKFITLCTTFVLNFIFIALFCKVLLSLTGECGRLCAIQYNTKQHGIEFREFSKNIFHSDIGHTWHILL